VDFVFHRSYRGPLKAVILDWAGTTVDYGSCAPAVAFKEVFKRRGLEITTAEAREPMGTHKKAHIRSILFASSVAGRWEDLHGQRPTQGDVESMYQELVPLLLQRLGLANHAELIPGTLNTVNEFRTRDLKIGSTTGYTSEMMKILVEEAAKRAYAPDCVVCASDVPAGRPYPWMCFQNAINLEVYPMEALVKVGDTLADIAEGLNAGMWTIGVAQTGNEVGLTEKEFAGLDPEARRTRLNLAYQRMFQAGAHYVVDSIAAVPPVIDEINERLVRGERP
jgi:phosphonoacetaldehyde hydrolase